MDPTEIAKVVKACRKASRLTQIELAKISGVGKTVIFDIEHGKATVQLNTLLNVLEALNIRLHLEAPITIEENE